jgi:hypothetical protein
LQNSHLNPSFVSVSEKEHLCACIMRVSNACVIRKKIAYRSHRAHPRAAPCDPDRTPRSRASGSASIGTVDWLSRSRRLSLRGSRCYRAVPLSRSAHAACVGANWMATATIQLSVNSLT